MNLIDFIPYIFSLISVIGSIITALFSIRLNFITRKEEIIFEHQKTLYIKFLNFLFNLQKNPDLQFSEKNLQILMKIQAEFFIYADKNIREQFIDIYSTLENLQKKYKEELKNETAIDEDNVRIETDYSAIFDIQAEEKYYKDTHKIVNELLELKISKTIKNIKKSLGIKF